MNFFNNRNNNKPDSPTSPPPTSHSVTDPQPSTPPPFNLPNPAPTNSQEESPKKARFPRLKKPAFYFPGRKAPNPTPSATDPLSAQLESTHITPPDPEKAARRAARRAQRQRDEEEWKDKNHQRRREARITDHPFVPLDPLPPFNSDSEAEDEKNKPESVAVVHPDGNIVNAAEEHPVSDADRTLYGPSTTAAQMPIENTHMESATAGPYLPQAPDVYEGALIEGPHPATPGSAHFPLHEGAVPPTHQPMPHHTAEQQHQQQPVRDTAAEAQMAEMYGRQAYMGITGMPASGATSEAMLSIQQHSQPQQYQQQEYPSVGQTPTPVGWGDAYGSVPSMPMYGNPMGLRSQAPLDVDYVLMGKIRRGRELGRLAVSQEEQSNLGAAEAGYMKALTLLVPAIKELDIGGELNRNARMQMKKKVQREATAMLDRVEELKVFLKANGPAIPNEMPTAPILLGSSLGIGKQGGGGRKGSDGSDKHGRGTRNIQEEEKRRASVERELGDKPSTGHRQSSPETTSIMVRPTAKVRPPADKKPVRPPPPPPPTFDHDSGELFERISSRKNMVMSASHAIQPIGAAALASNPSLKAPRAGGAACFMCNAAAQLVAPCNHTFCTKCGNQAANVFGKCPVPSCNEPLAKETFAELQ